MSKLLRVALLATFALVLRVIPLGAQQSALPEFLRVYLDCRSGGCDRNFFIQELPFVLWTQNQFDADLQVVVTSLDTGAGGSEYTVLLLGRGRFAGHTDTLTATVPPNSTDDMERREIARVLKIGLAPYALRTRSGPRISLAYAAPPADSNAANGAQADDPWNFWVFRVGTGGNIGAESQTKSYNVRGNFSASRTTERLKLNLGTNFNYSSLAFELDSGLTSNFMNRSGEVEASVVRSVTDHWSIAAGATAEFAEFRNLDLGARLELGAEWNYFHWREATSRQLVAIAAVGVRHFDYRDTTIYNLITETRPVAILKVASEVRQPWGELFAGVEHLRYLHDSQIYSLSGYGYLSVRLSRALRVNFGGNASKVNDQLYLPAGGLTPGEILTQQRALRTAYRVNFNLGMSYTFGSIYNTIVNPRFNNY